MQATVLAETEAFIAKQREALLTQRQEILNQQSALQAQLDEVDDMLAKFDVFGGKAARRQTRARRTSGARGGSRREELLKSIARTEEEGRSADDDPTVDLADKAANSYTKEFLFGQNNTDRAQDVSFVIDQLQKLNHNDPMLQNRLDVASLGMAG